MHRSRTIQGLKNFSINSIHLLGNFRIKVFLRWILPRRTVLSRSSLSFDTKNFMMCLALIYSNLVLFTNLASPSGIGMNFSVAVVESHALKMNRRSAHGQQAGTEHPGHVS